MIKIMLWSAMVTFGALVVLLMGCSDPVPDQRAIDRYQKSEDAKVDLDIEARKNCLKRGGVPIESAWDERIKECR